MRWRDCWQLPPHRHRTAACYLAGLAVGGSALAMMAVARNVGPRADRRPAPLYDPAWFLEKLPGGRRGRRARKDVFTDRFGGQTFAWHAATASAAAPTPGQPDSSSGYSPYQGGSADY